MISDVPEAGWIIRPFIGAATSDIRPNIRRDIKIPAAAKLSIFPHSSKK